MQFVMKYFVFGVLTLCACVQAIEGSTCDLHSRAEIKIPWEMNNINNCVQLMIEQVAHDLHASLTYLQMGAYFSQDTVNKAGFAKFFFEAANDEREQATKLIGYLSMRGALPRSIGTFIRSKLYVTGTIWSNGTYAMKDALKLELTVTASIKKIIRACESTSDYQSHEDHLIDFLTGEILEKQHKDERDLADKISTLNRLSEHHGALSEFLFDKKLLSGEHLL